MFQKARQCGSQITRITTDSSGVLAAIKSPHWRQSTSLSHQTKNFPARPRNAGLRRRPRHCQFRLSKWQQRKKTHVTCTLPWETLPPQESARTFTKKRGSISFLWVYAEKGSSRFSQMLNFVASEARNLCFEGRCFHWIFYSFQTLWHEDNPGAHFCDKIFNFSWIVMLVLHCDFCLQVTKLYCDIVQTKTFSNLTNLLHTAAKFSLFYVDKSMREFTSDHQLWNG